MIFLGLDILLSFLSPIPTFFVLLNLVLIPKNNLSKLVIITLIIDLLILNVYFLNTIIITLIFLFIKHLKITQVNLRNYFIVLSIIYFIYVLALGLINNYSGLYILKFIASNYFINILFYLLSYKILYKNIKLSR